jgi:methylphosphotriester-DNA--protein-cysteine methyltransferase
VAYWEAAPEPSLARFVEAVCFSTDDGGRASPPIRVIPDGRVDLLLSRASSGAGTARVFGAKTRALWVAEPGPVENVALRLRPGAAAALLGIDLSEITDEVLEVAALIGQDEVDALLELRSAAERGARLQRALRMRARDAEARLDARVVVAAQRLGERAGRVRIAELARALGLGERQLERAFRRHVGVAPKTFARIARFRRAWDQLERGGAALDVALARGYCDQPHLVRDFRAFAGEAPSRIFPSRGGAARSSLGA